MKLACMETIHVPDAKSDKLISKYLKRHGREQAFTPLQAPPWDAAFFQLDKSSLFQTFSPTQQEAILHECSQFLLLETYGIEKIGVNYCGKLCQIAPTMQQRQMFALIGSDEATHLQWFAPYIPETLRTQHYSPFLILMDDILGLKDANMLYYLVQIILEGWSIWQCKALEHFCHDETLSGIYKDALKDEAVHHHTGKVFFDASALGASEMSLIEDRLKAYCDIMRLGTKMLIQAIEKVVGPMSSKDKHTLLEETGSIEASVHKLKLLKSLMIQPGLEQLILKLEDSGYLTPYTIEKSVKLC